MTVLQLRGALKARGLPQNGSKESLILRLTVSSSSTSSTTSSSSSSSSSSSASASLPPSTSTAVTTPSSSQTNEADLNGASVVDASAAAGKKDKARSSNKRKRKEGGEGEAGKRAAPPHKEMGGEEEQEQEMPEEEVRQSYMKKTCEQLKDQCKALGLACRGKKDELIARLCQALGLKFGGAQIASGVDTAVTIAARTDPAGDEQTAMAVEEAQHQPSDDGTSQRPGKKKRKRETESKEKEKEKEKEKKEKEKEKEKVEEEIGRDGAVPPNDDGLRPEVAQKRAELSKLKVTELQEVMKTERLTGFSRRTKDELVSRLIQHYFPSSSSSSSTTPAPAPPPTAPAPSRVRKRKANAAVTDKGGEEAKGTDDEVASKRRREEALRDPAPSTTSSRHHHNKEESQPTNEGPAPRPSNPASDTTATATATKRKVPGGLSRSPVSVRPTQPVGTLPSTPRRVGLSRKLIHHLHPTVGGGPKE